MQFLTWLAQRRKAVVAFVVGVLNVFLLYLLLISDGVFTNGDAQALVVSIITWLGGTALVHQATNENI